MPYMLAYRKFVPKPSMMDPNQKPNPFRVCRVASPLSFIILIGIAWRCRAADSQLSDSNSLYLPTAGSYQLRVITPTILELTLITTKQPDPARVEQWDFIDAKAQERLPSVSEFKVSAGDKIIPVKAIGFKRRVLYAPLKHRDLRIGNYLYLQLGIAISHQQDVSVKKPSHKLWLAAISQPAKVCGLDS